MRLTRFLLMLAFLAVLAGCTKDRPFWGGDGRMGEDGRKIWDTNGKLESEEERKFWDTGSDKEKERKIWVDEEDEEVVD